MNATDSHRHSLTTVNYIPWLKGSPPPPHTHTQKVKQNCVSDVSKFKSWGGNSGAMPRKCSPLTQIRRQQEKPGPLLLVYFMGEGKYPWCWGSSWVALFILPRAGQAVVGSSVPDPKDPYVFGTPRFVSRRYGSGSLYYQATSNLIPTVLQLLNDFLSLKKWCTF